MCLDLVQCKRMLKRLIILPFFSIILPACSVGDLPFVYKIDVQQGNVYTQEMISQVQLGMNKTQVQGIMGTPLLTDVFDVNRWDYYTSDQFGREPREQERLTLFFDNDQLAHVEHTGTFNLAHLVSKKNEHEALKAKPHDLFYNPRFPEVD